MSLQLQQIMCLARPGVQQLLVKFLSNMESTGE